MITPSLTVSKRASDISPKQNIGQQPITLKKTPIGGYCLGGSAVLDRACQKRRSLARCGILADNRGMSVDIIAFDVFNTLAQWPDKRVLGIEIQQLLDRYHVPISYQAYEAARQGVFFFDAVKRPIQGYVDFLALQFDRMGVRVSLDLIQSIAAVYESRNHLELFPDAIDALDTARSAGKMTIAFTTLPRFMLGRAGDELIPRLDRYFDISTIGIAKGDRRFYERITKTLAVDGGAILCVGDDPIGDCQVPAEAGWQAVLLDREGRHAHHQVGQCATIRSLSELATLIG